MSKHTPVTKATIHLDKLGITYIRHTYDYQRKGSDVAAEGLNVGLHEVIKTLIMQKDDGGPFVVLQHGDVEVSLKDLARQIGTKNVESCEIKDAQRYTGYLVGGISPFGTKRSMPVYVEETILQMNRFFINGGLRGFILELTPADLRKALKLTPVRVARP